METARCRAFLAAAETGSFSKAAEALSYTPSGVNQLVTARQRHHRLLFQYRHPLAACGHQCVPA